MKTKTLVLYQRVNLEREGEHAWQIENNSGRKLKVLATSSFRKPITLEEFAINLVELDSLLINGGDALTTIPAPVMVPDNNYMDRPLKEEQLKSFWDAYIGRRYRGNLNNKP